jgi:hypothetical protein
LSSDRGVFELNIDVILQQDDEPITTIRVTPQPMIIAFFEIPGKTHPDYTFLRERYIGKGGLMQGIK